MFLLFFAMFLSHTVGMRLTKAILIFLFVFLLPVQVFAQNAGLSIIRDTEIEKALRERSTPIWRAAGLNPDAVKIVLVQSPELNAFVAGGSNIFVFTGLIEATKSPGELLGVIAHETGHIAGGHLIRGREAMQHASYESILATILGIGAALSGNGQASTALIVGGKGLAISSFLAHSRVQESSADQAALTFMEAAQYNPSGLLNFLGTLKNQEFLPESQQSSYFRTHPLTSDRIDAMQRGVTMSSYTQKYPDAMIDRYNRIKAKLIGFIEPRRIDWVYAEKDTSVSALYAKAIAAYKQSNKQKALNLINGLIAREPKNPWFYELKAQMLRDFGQVPEALDMYRKAVDLAPDAALIRIDLAQLLIEMAQGFTEAEKNLDLAFKTEPTSTEIQRLYATLYGRAGQEFKAKYHLAEEATLKGNISEAQKLLKGAMPGLNPGSTEYRRANDLKAYLDAQPKEDDKKNH
jgi:predicted Zn-dependent protease